MTQENTSDKPTRQRLCFGPERRLKKTAEFKRLFDNRTSVADSRLIVYGMPNRLSYSRVGISAGKRLGPAVQRNRYKRTLREAFRRLQYELPANCDYVLIPRRSEKISTEMYCKSLLPLCRKLSKKLKKKSRNQ